jgi:carboxypeptidase PM20D1
MKRFIALAFCALLSACGAPEQAGPEPLEPAGSPYDDQALASLLSEAIRFQTISEAGDPRASWGAFEGFRVMLAERFPLAHARLNPRDLGDGALLFTWQGSRPDLDPIVFIAHQDVVPVEPGTEGDWTHPPFDGVIADGFVWGRGAIDMKGHLVTLMAALESLIAEGFEPERTIHVALGPDEEVGGLGAQRAAAAIAARGETAWFVLDEGGAIVTDFPLTGAPVAMIAVAEKGYLTVELTARARGGHSSVPPERTAVGLLAEAIRAIETDPFERSLEGGPTKAMLRALAPELDGVAAMAAARPGLFGPVLLGEVASSDAGRALLGTTIAPTIVSGGVKDNVLPQEARAVINLRLHPRDTVESALAHLRASVAHLDGVTIEADPQGANDPPAMAQTEGRAWDIIAGAAVGHAPEGTPAAPVMVPGATDIRHFDAVAENLYRFAAVRTSLEDFQRAHGTDERIPVDSLDEMTSYFRTLMRAAAGPGQPVP